jgi:lipoprotein-anchoring transpeptidase ErfK/SrfK
MTTKHRSAIALGILALAALALSSCTSGGPAAVQTVTRTAAPAGPSTPASSSSTVPGTPASSTSTSGGPTETVHVTSLESDGARYGVGMPIVLFFTPAPTDSSEFTKAVKVTVGGRPADGAWYWEQPTHDEVVSHTYEAHYRLEHYWPAHSKIHVDIPIGGLSAGAGLVYSDRLTSLDFDIGAKHVSHVSGAKEKMRVFSDGKLVNSFPVSLGEAAHPTYTGVKVVMQKGEDVPGTNKLRPNGTVLMSGPGYTDSPVEWSVRITRSGEYLHSAPWNGEIGARSTSHGCTNLRPADGRWFYHFAQVGDVVTYARTGGGDPMPVWDGLGDWNAAWSVWSQGGLLLNH